MQIVELPVEQRDKLGSANSRRYRRAGRIPCVLYGRGKESLSLITDRADFEPVLKAHTALVRLNLGGQAQTALIREITWDTFGEFIQHVDLSRVELSDEVHVTVPLVYNGVPAGASEGGTLEVILKDLELVCRVESIPTEIPIDVSALEIGDGLSVSDIEFPANVRPAGDLTMHLVHVAEPRKIEEPVAEEGVEPAEGEAAPAAEPAPEE